MQKFLERDFGPIERVWIRLMLYSWAIGGVAGFAIPVIVWLQ